MPAADPGRYPRAMDSSLPLGVYHVDAWGLVRAHVSVAAGVSESSRAVGRNFFEEVAPCTNCAEFRGRFEALIRRGGGSDGFTYRLRYPWCSADVRVRMFGSSSRGAWLLIADPVVCELYNLDAGAKASASEL